MLTVKTKIGPSKIAGIGLFADQFIPKGTVVWKFMPGFSLLLSKGEIDRLSEPVEKQVYNYAYLDNNYGKWCLNSDDARFFNHSDDPNCDDRVKDLTTAIRDIHPGEEMTVNYKLFYSDVKNYPEIQ